MSNFAERIGMFHRNLDLDVQLPDGVVVMNPYREDSAALTIADAFYRKFYSDNDPRQLILGINPGRFGGARTGVPFTDFKRLVNCCGIAAEGRITHEPSSEFIYRMIGELGGAGSFYQRFFIHSVCPLGFTKRNASGRDVNFNYYDDPSLLAAVRPFILKSLHQYLGLGCGRRIVYCLGIENARQLRRLNDEEGLFDEIRALPHPRFIMQYRRRFLDEEIARYRDALNIPSER